jgi:hypothetical protein
MPYWTKVQYKRFLNFAKEMLARTMWLMAVNQKQGFRRRGNMSGIVQTKEKTLLQKLLGLIAGSVLLLLLISSASAQEVDATVKITRRTVAEGIGLSWGEGVLTYE